MRNGGPTRFRLRHIIVILLFINSAYHSSSISNMWLRLRCSISLSINCPFLRHLRAQPRQQRHRDFRFCGSTSRSGRPGATSARHRRTVVTSIAAVTLAGVVATASGNIHSVAGLGEPTDMLVHQRNNLFVVVGRKRTRELA